MIIEDAEFGEVVVRRNALCRRGKFSVATSGRLQLTVPVRTSNRRVRDLIEECREQIRSELPLRNPDQQRARDEQNRLLRKKARDFLPYRLAYLAKLHGYEYTKVKLAHQGTRWGSCTTGGVISLNIELMRLPEELRDHVLLHELAHLKHPNHSAEFWGELAAHDPKWREHRERLKRYVVGE